MRIFLLAIMLVGICLSAEAGIVVCYDQNSNIINYSLTGEQKQGCLFLDAGQNITVDQANGIRALFKTISMKYLKVSNGLVVEKTILEKTQADLDEQESIRQQETTNVAVFNVSNEDIIIALVQTINKRLSAGQKITKQEIIDQIKANKGL